MCVLDVVRLEYVFATNALFIHKMKKKKKKYGTSLREIGSNYNNFRFGFGKSRFLFALCAGLSHQPICDAANRPHQHPDILDSRPWMEFLIYSHQHLFSKLPQCYSALGQRYLQNIQNSCIENSDPLTRAREYLAYFHVSWVTFQSTFDRRRTC